VNNFKLAKQIASSYSRWGDCVLCTLKKHTGWILPGQDCEIIEENDSKFLVECFDGYDGTLKREWIEKDFVVLQDEY